MRLAGLILMLAGILLLGSEGLGKTRAQAMEKGLLKLAKNARTGFSQALSYIFLPNRHKNNSIPTPNQVVPSSVGKSVNIILNRWVLSTFLGISLLSLIFIAPKTNAVYVLPWNDFSVRVWVIGAVSYGTLISSSLLTLLLSLALPAIPSKINFFTVALSTILVLIAFGLLLLTVLGFVGTLAFSYPAVVIFACYLVLYAFAYLLSSFIEWKDSLKAGSLFIILGTALSLAGAVLLYIG